MFQDHEGCFGAVTESSIDPKLWELSDLSDYEAEAYACYAEYVGGNELPDVDDFRDHYQGQWDSAKAYAEHLAEESGWIKAMEDAGINASYFDAEQFAHDLEVSGDIWMSDNGHVFSNY